MERKAKSPGVDRGETICTPGPEEEEKKEVVREIMELKEIIEALKEKLAQLLH